LKILLASRNEHKLRELRAALPGWELEPLRASDDPVEDRASFLENARIKARHGRAYAGPGEWVAGEDSGIEVVALDGRPGVESARWAVDPVARLLEELQGVVNRRARYVCELVVLSPDRKEVRSTGTLAGAIASEPRGNEGFGYDPIFVPEGEEQTVAELGNEWKARHSHRARAARNLAHVLAIVWADGR
jgi:XTP/dITP diphosphohydrolase